MTTASVPQAQSPLEATIQRLRASFAASDEVTQYTRLGFVLVIVLVGSLGAWAAGTEIAGAVLASGTVVVDGSSKKVQHPTGGVAGQLLVRDGDVVEAGQVLVRLDSTVAKANLDLITKQLDEIAIRTARLTAEIEGRTSFTFPESLSDRANEPHIAASMATEAALFESRRTGRERQIGQLRERIAQLGKQAEGIAAQEKARRTELELAGKQRDALDKLEEHNLVNIAKITDARRIVAQLEGSLADVIAQGAQVRAKISETELQILEIEQNVKTEAGKDLREQQAKAAELSERRIPADDQLRRIDIVAPQSGIVHQMSIHTVGGVVAPGEPLMLVVPQDERLVVEAKIPPQSIDQIKHGAPARIRFSAFDHRTTPEFKAKVSRVSADLVLEQQLAKQPGAAPAPQAAAFYTVRLELDDVSALKDLKLVPGMPAEVHITTQDRTALSFLMKPLSDQFNRAFRER